MNKMFEKQKRKVPARAQHRTTYRPFQRIALMERYFLSRKIVYVPYDTFRSGEQRSSVLFLLNLQNHTQIVNKYFYIRRTIENDYRDFWNEKIYSPRKLPSQCGQYYQCTDPKFRNDFNKQKKRKKSLQNMCASRSCI